MKILVGGCSFSTGYGLADQKQNSWPNLLAKKLNADLKNVSVPGYDNQGIFLNLIKECTTTHYDLILFQVTSLSRLVLSPNMHGIVGLSTLCNTDDFSGWDQWFTLSDWQAFQRLCVKINGDFEHWKRLLAIIVICQNLISQGYNIRFVNGLLDWDKDFFTTDRSKWAATILDIDTLPDQDIQDGLNQINLAKKQIDLKHWINPFDSFLSLKVDHASAVDSHPGLQSQQIYTNLLFNSLTQ